MGRDQRGAGLEDQRGSRDCRQKLCWACLSSLTTKGPSSPETRRLQVSGEVPGEIRDRGEGRGVSVFARCLMVSLTAILSLAVISNMSADTAKYHQVAN